LLGDETDQLIVRFAIDRRRLQLCLPRTVSRLRQLGRTRARLHFYLKYHPIMA
jgi:hypothetical protein